MGFVPWGQPGGRDDLKTHSRGVRVPLPPPVTLRAVNGRLQPTCANAVWSYQPLGCPP